MFDDCNTLADEWIHPPFVDARFAPLSASRDEVANCTFNYRGAEFRYTVHKLGPTAFQSRVVYRYGIRDIEQFVLPHDVAPSETEADARTYAERQATGWWHDRIGASEATLIW